MIDWIPWIAWINAVVDAAVGAAIIALACAGRKRMTGGWLLMTGTVAIGLSGVSLLAKCAVIAKLSQTPLSAVYLALVWIACTPLMISLFAWLMFRQTCTPLGRRLIQGFAALSLLASLTAGYASLIEPYWLEVREVEVPLAGLPPDTPPIRVAVLADIQTNVVGPYERYWMDRLKAQQPDMILMPGDFFHVHSEELERKRDQFIALLRELEAPYGVYACQGNIDSLSELKKIMAATDIKLLVDEVQIAHVHGVRIAIGGTRHVGGQVGTPPLRQKMRHYDADLRLMMAHVPDAVWGSHVSHKIDLIISGHTHGGQVQIPGFGPLLIMSSVPLHVGAGGLHVVKEQLVYVSRGIGHERNGAPPLRFWCRPELTILKLVPDNSRQNPLVSTGY